MQTEESIIRLSGENIIEMIRDNRNEVIQKLLNDNTLKLYLKDVAGSSLCTTSAKKGAGNHSSEVFIAP